VDRRDVVLRALGIRRAARRPPAFEEQVDERDPSGRPRPAGTLRFQDAEAIFAIGPLRDAAWGERKDPPITKKGDAYITRYDELPPDADKYVICHYGDGFYQALKLSPATKVCDVIRRPDRKEAKGRKAAYAVTDIICR